MTKIERSPDKPKASPNPRPRRRNKQQRETVIRRKQQDSPAPTPIQTPINTPERTERRPPADNSFLALQSDSEDEDRTVNTIAANDPQIEIERVQRDTSTTQTEVSIAAETANRKQTPVINPVPTPDDLKRETRLGPLPDIPPTDLERMKESIPIFASDLVTTVGQLFPEPNPTPTMLKKPPPVASIPVAPEVTEDPKETDRKLAEDIFGRDAGAEDSKPAAIEQSYADPTVLMDIDQAVPLPPVQVEQQESISNVDTIIKLNESIEKNQQSLLKLQEMLRIAKDSTASDGQSPKINSGVETKATQHAPEIIPGTNSSSVTNMEIDTNVETDFQPAQRAPASVSATTRDPLTELTMQKPVYPKLPEPSPKRPYFYRATWRIQIPNDMDSPVQGLVDGISEIWNVLKGIDDKLILYPWRQTNHGRYKALSGPSKIPNTKEGINRYFPDAYFRPHPGPMYLNLYLGSTFSFEDLSKETQFFFGVKQNRNRVAFWHNELQFENIVEIGWLYRSTPGMSSKTIQQQLFAHTGIHTALRWRIISQPVKGELKKEIQIKALHISVRREDENLAKAKFTKLIFARHRKSHFIGGSPMRLIPLSRHLSVRNQAKCVYYTSCQGSFLSEIEASEIFTILDIDSKAIGLNGRTLRELILEIPLRNNSSIQAFLSADRTFNKSTVKLYFYTKNKAECHSRVATLLPYLIFTNPSLDKGIRRCFSAEANERAKGVRWDPDQKEVITVDDEMFETSLDLDDEEDVDNPSEKVQKIMLEFEAAGLASIFKVQEGEAASLFSQSTIRSKKKPNGMDSSAESDDTPKTINRSTPTAQTEALSSLSDGVPPDLKTQLDIMTKALLQLTTLVPNTPDNQVALANIRAILPSSQSAGSSSEASGPGPQGPGALLR